MRYLIIPGTLSVLCEKKCKKCWHNYTKLFIVMFVYFIHNIFFSKRKNAMVEVSLRNCRFVVCTFSVVKKLLFTKLSHLLKLALVQWCPTLSPFATCGDRSFKCGDRRLFGNRLVMINKPYITQIFQFTMQSGDGKKLVGHHCSSQSDIGLLDLLNNLQWVLFK